MTRPLRVAAAVAAAYALLSPSEAGAKIMLITSGDTIKDLGSGKNGNVPVKVGYKYSYGGVFWVDFWTWDGTYCIYNDVEKKYQPISEADAAALLGKPTGSLGKPFLYRFPLGLLILGGFLALAAVGAVVGRKGSGEAEQTPYERAG